MVMGQYCCVRLLIRYQHETSPNRGLQKEFFLNLVVGTWFVVLTVILGLADGTIWLLDQGWKKNRKATPACRVLAVESLSRGTS